MSDGKDYPFIGVMGLFAVSILLAGCTCASPPGAFTSQRDTATLHVQVQMRLLPGVALPDMPAPEARPCEGAGIEVLDDNGRPFALGTCDNDGMFTTTVPPGRYRIAARCLDAQAEIRETTLRAGMADTMRFLITVAAP